MAPRPDAAAPAQSTLAVAGNSDREAAGLVDVTSDAKARQSSVHEPWGDAQAALRGSQGDYTFRTRVERNPWWEAELASVAPIRRIIVWNRRYLAGGWGGRRPPLAIRLATTPDGPWRDIARIDYVFGGPGSGRPLLLDLAEPVPARFVRLQAEGEAALQLDRVRIFAGAPVLRFADVTGLRRCSDLRFGAGLRLRHRAGFFSICSTLLDSILDLHRCGIVAEQVDCSSSFVDFRGAGDDVDLYQRLFRADPTAQLHADQVPRFRPVGHHHLHYRDLDFPAVAPYLRRYFQPSDATEAMHDALLARRGLDPTRLIGLCWRGTDKHREVPPTDVSAYIALADRLLATDPTLRVLVQTDQVQARDAVVAHFGERCVFFEEMPVTDGAVVMHRLDLERLYGMPREDFARTLLASVLAVASCRHLITHTGNVGLWLALFRGSAENLYQFDRRRMLVPPEGPATSA